MSKLLYFRNPIKYISHTVKEASWSWSYGSCISNYLCNQCLSPLMLWVRTPLRWGVLDTTLCDKVYQWFATGQCFSPVSSTNKTGRHDINEILLKVVLNTINQPYSQTCIQLVTGNYLFGQYGSHFLILLCFCSNLQLISSLFNNLIA
jgi:hypothetical protein